MSQIIEQQFMANWAMQEMNNWYFKLIEINNAYFRLFHTIMGLNKIAHKIPTPNLFIQINHLYYDLQQSKGNPDFETWFQAIFILHEECSRLSQ